MRFQSESDHPALFFSGGINDAGLEMQVEVIIYVYQLINATREDALLLFVMTVEQQIPDGTTRTQNLLESGMWGGRHFY